HGAVDIDPRLYAQNDAGVLVIDVVHDRRGGHLDRHRALRRDRDLVADLKGGHVVVEYDQRGIREYLHVSDGLQGIDDQARRRFRPDEEIEPRNHPRDQRGHHRAGGRGGGPGGGCGGRGGGSGGLAAALGEKKRALVLAQPDIAALEEELYAV